MSKIGGAPQPPQRRIYNDPERQDETSFIAPENPLPASDSRSASPPATGWTTAKVAAIAGASAVAATVGTLAVAYAASRSGASGLVHNSGGVAPFTPSPPFPGCGLSSDVNQVVDAYRKRELTYDQSMMLTFAGKNAISRLWKTDRLGNSYPSNSGLRSIAQKHAELLKFMACKFGPTNEALKASTIDAMAREIDAAVNGKKKTTTDSSEPAKVWLDLAEMMYDEMKEIALLPPDEAAQCASTSPSSTPLSPDLHQIVEQTARQALEEEIGKIPGPLPWKNGTSKEVDDVLAEILKVAAQLQSCPKSVSMPSIVSLKAWRVSEHARTVLFDDPHYDGEKTTREQVRFLDEMAERVVDKVQDIVNPASASGTSTSSASATA